MAPVPALKDNPAGKSGLIPHEVAVPPVVDGVAVVMV